MNRFARVCLFIPVLMSVSVGVLGGIAAVAFTGLSFDVYAQIGLVVLIALAACLGAPFWFDVLNKFMVVRSTVKPKEKSGVEAPKEPQAKGS